jgi:hypothetical protein
VNAVTSRKGGKIYYISIPPSWKMEYGILCRLIGDRVKTGSELGLTHIYDEIIPAMRAEGVFLTETVKGNVPRFGFRVSVNFIICQNPGEIGVSIY